MPSTSNGLAAILARRIATDGPISLADYMALLDGRTAQNTAAFIPYANVRTLACGFGQRFPDDYQMYEIKRLVQQGMDD